MHFQTEVTIERPRDDVFRRLAEELNITMPLICPLTTSVRLDSATALAVGATGKITIRNTFVSRIVHFAVTRYLAPEQLSLELHYRDRSARADYLFRESGTSTTVTLIADAPEVGPRWVQGWNRWARERHERQDAQRLKALLEGRQNEPVRAYRRSLVRIVVIAWALAALLGVALALERALTS